MPLIEQIQKEMIAAMKAKDSERLGTLRMMKTALKKQEVDGGKPLDPAAERKVLATMVKQRKDAIEMYTKGGREDLARTERGESVIIESYLPARATAEEMEAAVREAVRATGADSMKQMGAVMKAAKQILASKTVDGKALSQRVKAALTQP